ncbi:hypothetical protein YQE_01957, partial [Dendroctonus ponderosae]
MEVKDMNGIKYGKKLTRQIISKPQECRTKVSILKLCSMEVTKEWVPP